MQLVARYIQLWALLVSLAAAGWAGSPATAKPAKQYFGAKSKAAALPTGAVGSYAKGCLAGGAMLPVDGPAWQAMRLSRNRNWGHPELVRYVERLARESREIDGWPGLLIGDLAQPRGGPMLSGHRSHQIGLDADIWLMPMPDRKLSQAEREKISAISMIKNVFSINEKYWKPGHATLLKRAASYPEVARIFIHPTIKKALCESDQAGPWLRKIRPWWGHHYHFHVRLRCPRGSVGCVDQKPPPEGTGCGKPIEEWFAKLRKAKPAKPGAKPKPRKELRMADLPNECRAVLEAKDAMPGVSPVAAEADDREKPGPAVIKATSGLPWLRRLPDGADAGVQSDAPVPPRKPEKVKPAAAGVDTPDRKPASAVAVPETQKSQAKANAAGSSGATFPERKPKGGPAPARKVAKPKKKADPGLPWLQGITTPTQKQQ